MSILRDQTGMGALAQHPVTALSARVYTFPGRLLLVAPLPCALAMNRLEVVQGVVVTALDVIDLVRPRLPADPTDVTMLAERLAPPSLPITRQPLLPVRVAPATTSQLAPVRSAHRRE